MKKLLLVPLLIALLVVVYLLRPIQKPAEPVEKAERPKTALVVENQPLSPQVLLEQTNTERAKAGVKPVVLDERLNRSAQRKLSQSIEEKSFTHSEASGKRGAEYIWEEAPECVGVGENLAGSFEQGYLPNPILGFSTSKPHWEAVLNPDHEAVGFATTAMLLVMHFCDLD